MQNKKIYVLTLCWNEAKILPFFLAYYETFCEKIVIFDNLSTDGSADMIKNHPKCIYETLLTDSFSDSAHIYIKNNAWKKYKNEADWFITIDMDEFLSFNKLSPHSLIDYCESHNFSVIQPYGYDMVINENEELCFNGRFDLFEKYKIGVANKSYDKACFFNIQKVDEINLTPGGHFCDYKGKGYIYKNPEVKLLHYRYMGLKWLLDRYRSYAVRLSAENKEKRWGINYLDKEKEIIDLYRKKFQESKNVFIDLSKSQLFLQPFMEIGYKLGFSQKKSKKTLRKAKLGL
jgi:hypothetical protein